MKKTLPIRNGVSPSCVVLPATTTTTATMGQATLLDGLAHRFPGVHRSEWARRIEAGDVVNEHGVAITPGESSQAFQGGIRLYYYRDLGTNTEQAIPFHETVIYQDRHLLVADKPHFLPVTPSGPYLQHTLLVRLKHRLGLPELSPLHRIDRGTAGLVLFSVERATRGRYQALFRDRAITKEYEAIAPWRTGLVFPRNHISRLEESAQFFRMQEVAGPPNTHTRIELLEVCGDWGRYRLWPTTGKRHQLRVHMAALGLPLRHDAFYPVVNDPPQGDFSKPLQLLARSLEFTDPLTNQRHRFQSTQSLW